ncbi:MAG: hypothetical protein IKN90_00405 [Treponema sp.]|nr:hypothetical protein [Treponema sp.]
MEKQPTRFSRKKFLGLLIFCINIITSSQAFCQATSSSSGKKPSWQYVQSLHFKKAKEYFFTDEESIFSVDIEGVEPEDVTVFVNDVPKNVSFLSSKKELYVGPSDNPLDDMKRGTHLEIVFQFMESGVFHISPIDVRVNGMYNRLNLDTVLVYENPNTVQPQIYLEFEDPSFNAAGKKLNASVGDHVTFMMYIRYAVQILNFSWEIPENSLFDDVKRFPITEGTSSGNQFSPSAVPVAKFDWQPLSEGEFSLPAINITAITYGGKKVDVPFPVYKVSVSPKKETQYKTEQDGVFGYAFSTPFTDAKSTGSEQKAKVDLERLLELHQRERHSFHFLSSAYKERRAAEDEYGIAHAEIEISVPGFIAVCIASALLIAITLILFLSRKFMEHKIVLVLSMMVSIVLSVTSVCMWFKVNKSYGLFKGGSINPIPEINVHSSASIPRGNVVRIEKKTNGWLYIRYHETYGWVMESEVLVIK